MELLPTIDALHWCADAAPKILADERIAHPAGLPEAEAELLLLRAARRRRRDRALELPLVDPVRRDRDRADRRQRRRAEAREPHPAARRADPARLRGRRPSPGAGAHRPRRAARSARRSARPRPRRSSSPARSRSAGGSARLCAGLLKGSVLELGGKDPQIVCADADLANAVSGCVWGAFANAGQTCSGIERTYVVESVADEFLAGVRRETERLTVGDPLDWETEIGPMVSAEQADLVTELVDDALASRRRAAHRGPASSSTASAAASSPRPCSPGSSDEMRMMREEIFGPVAPDRRRRERAGGARARQRLELRPRRVGVDDGPGEGRADRAEDRVGDGLDQRPLLLARRGASAPGAGSRTPASDARTPSSAFTSAATSSSSPGSPASPATSGGSPTTRTSGAALRSSARLLYGRGAARLSGLRDGLGPLAKVARRTVRRRA